ncbi:hypothetical protein K461DRAFT_19136 [Myriangium duriaei CBS 260.36]|uniref:Uncharacterized protein n=1 Tax=Myriangium duriaei CBS 260.36 TaxID=1168546 RepID=A0A9P4JBA8_9PEZI|nr:hypothetical protein K461DRAFT_19136 [Myriangium duriaei CBS 260.36]
MSTAPDLWTSTYSYTLAKSVERRMSLQEEIRAAIYRKIIYGSSDGDGGAQQAREPRWEGQRARTSQELSFQPLADLSLLPPPHTDFLLSLFCPPLCHRIPENLNVMHRRCLHPQQIPGVLLSGEEIKSPNASRRWPRRLPCFACVTTGLFERAVQRSLMVDLPAISALDAPCHCRLQWSQTMHVMFGTK